MTGLPLSSGRPACFEGSVPSFQKPADYPGQPQLLIGSDSDVNAFGDVCSDGVSAFLEVEGGVVGGSLLEHLPVCGLEAVLKCLYRPLLPHSHLFPNWFGDFNQWPVYWH